MLRIATLFVLVVLNNYLFSELHAQEVRVSGYLLNSQNEKLRSGEIWVFSGDTVLSDTVAVIDLFSSGDFSLNLDSGSYWFQGRPAIEAGNYVYTYYPDAFFLSEAGKISVREGMDSIEIVVKESYKGSPELTFIPHLVEGLVEKDVETDSRTSVRRRMQDALCSLTNLDSLHTYYVLSDENGKVSFDSLSPGSYSLLTEDPVGYYPLTKFDFSLRDADCKIYLPINILYSEFDDSVYIAIEQFLAYGYDNCLTALDHSKYIKIFPSPFSNIIQIDSHIPIHSVSVYDMSGRAILNFSGFISRNEINTASWLQGVYQLVFELPDGSHYSKKVIKK